MTIVSSVLPQTDRREKILSIFGKCLLSNEKIGLFFLQFNIKKNQVSFLNFRKYDIFFSSKLQTLRRSLNYATFQIGFTCKNHFN